MAKSLLYVLVATVLVYVIEKVLTAVLGPFLLEGLVLNVIAWVVMAIIAGYVAYKAKTRLNKTLGKNAVSGLFFGLLAYILCVVFYSIDRSVMIEGLSIIFFNTGALGLLIGSIVAGKKTA